MEAYNSILNEVIDLQAYFKAGYNQATGLRKKLERVAPASPSGELRPDEIAKKLAARHKTVLKKSK